MLTKCDGCKVDLLTEIGKNPGLTAKFCVWVWSILTKGSEKVTNGVYIVMGILRLCFCTTPFIDMPVVCVVWKHNADPLLDKTPLLEDKGTLDYLKPSSIRWVTGVSRIFSSALEVPLVWEQRSVIDQSRSCRLTFFPLDFKLHRRARYAHSSSSPPLLNPKILKIFVPSIFDKPHILLIPQTQLKNIPSKQNIQLIVLEVKEPQEVTILILNIRIEAYNT